MPCLRMFPGKYLGKKLATDQNSPEVGGSKSEPIARLLQKIMTETMMQTRKR